MTSAYAINSRLDQPLASGDSGTIENVFGWGLMKNSLFYPPTPPLCLPSLISDLCGPLPAGVYGDSVVLGVLHAALLPGPAHLVELPPDLLRPCQSGPGESGAARSAR